MQPKKFSLLSLDLYKERNENDNEEQAIEIFASSEMTTLYLDGLSNEDFFKMLIKMLNILFMFSSQGSGWILRKVNRLEIKIAFAPVHASSYIALPGFLNGCRSLLNIRNHFDHNCFVYCFVAAYHIENRINLLTEGRSGTKDESRYVQECGTTAGWRLSDAHAHKQDPILCGRQRRSRQCFRVSVSLIISIKTKYSR